MPKTFHPILDKHFSEIDAAISDECRTDLRHTWPPNIEGYYGQPIPTLRVDETNPKDKLASTKPDLTLVPPVANIFEAGVMGLGAKKYGAYNWRSKKVRMTVYLAAMQRHLAAVLDGEDCDEESRLPHIAHIRANTGILLDAQAGGNLIDDRPVDGVSSRVLKEQTR